MRVFRAPRTIQGIADEKAIEYSKYLWNCFSAREHYKTDIAKFDDIFMMLDDEEMEDLVFFFLQGMGWYVSPNSRKADSMRFEYLAVNPKTGEKALVQVKTGKVSLNTGDFSQYPYTIFLFQSNELYYGNVEKNVSCIKRGELKNFLKKSLGWLPTVFKTEMEMIESSNT